MKKTFKLQIEGKHPDRLLESIKHEIRKYVKRQRRVPLPPDVDFWDFDCRFGSDLEQSAEVHFATLDDHINAAAKAELPGFFIEIVAKKGLRTKRPSAAEITSS